LRSSPVTIRSPDCRTACCFTSGVEQALAQVGRGATAAILYIDLDRFKASERHPGTRRRRRFAAHRRRPATRLRAGGDTVARLGGDEFVIVQTGWNGRKMPACWLAASWTRSANHTSLTATRFVTGACVGVSVMPTDGTHPEKLIKNADPTLYRAKPDGRATCKFFEPEMDARVQARRELELDVRRALVTEEFELFYQPLVDLRSDKICGFEALMR
jgi:diguanylate cyclase (GGDEF)-like protein